MDDNELDHLWAELAKVRGATDAAGVPAADMEALALWMFENRVRNGDAPDVDGSARRIIASVEQMVADDVSASLPYQPEMAAATSAEPTTTEGVDRWELGTIAVDGGNLRVLTDGSSRVYLDPPPAAALTVLHLDAEVYPLERGPNGDCLVGSPPVIIKRFLAAASKEPTLHVARLT